MSCDPDKEIPIPHEINMMSRIPASQRPVEVLAPIINSLFRCTLRRRQPANQIRRPPQRGTKPISDPGDSVIASHGPSLRTSCQESNPSRLGQLANNREGNVPGRFYQLTIPFEALSVAHAVPDNKQTTPTKPDPVSASLESLQCSA
jgi:hypothetical protein